MSKKMFNALLGGEELSEEFQEKAKTIFEAAINAKLLKQSKKLMKHYTKQSLQKKSLLLKVTR